MHRILAFLLLLAGPALAHPHISPSMWVNYEIKDEGVTAVVTIRRDLLNPWLGGKLTVAAIEDIDKPMDDAKKRAVLAAARAYMAAHNPVSIDRRAVEPVGKSLEPPESLYGTNRLEYLTITLFYPADAPPQRVDFVWQAFEGAKWENQTVVPGLLKVGSEPDVLSFTPEERGFVWHATERKRRVVRAVAPEPPPPAWRLPLLSLALALIAVVASAFLLRGVPPLVRLAPLPALGFFAWLALDTAVVEFRPPWSDVVKVPSGEQAEVVFDTLLKNVYAAFAADDEDTIYDLLAVSVDASMLDKVYGDIYESLILREQGGAVTKVDSIEVTGKHVELPPEAERDTWPPRFEVRWKWRVHCSVTHWGHTHKRVNEYAASFAIKHDGRSWKIAGMQVEEHKRLNLDQPAPVGAGDGMDEFR